MDCFRLLLINIEEKKKISPILVKTDDYQHCYNHIHQSIIQTYFSWAMFISEDHCWRESAGARWTESLGKIWNFYAPFPIECAHPCFLLSTLMDFPSLSIPHGHDAQQHRSSSHMKKGGGPRPAGPGWYRHKGDNPHKYLKTAISVIQWLTAVQQIHPLCTATDINRFKCKMCLARWVELNVSLICWFSD